MKSFQSLRGILEVRRIVPSVVRVVTSPLGLVLQFLVMGARTLHVIDQPLFFSVNFDRWRRRDYLSGQRVHPSLPKTVRVEHVVHFDSLGQTESVRVTNLLNDLEWTIVLSVELRTEYE